MATVALVGLGQISRHYKAGLTDGGPLKLVAVCDLLEDAPARKLYEAYPFYKDYKAMLETVKPDYVIISTPPATHLAMAVWALQKGVGVLLEKPAVQNDRELEELIRVAKACHAPLIPMLHWQHSAEILAFCAMYDPGKISKICVELKDPYSADGVTINPDRRGLLGTWLDSGINVLSYLAMVLPFERVETVCLSTKKCAASGQPIYFAGSFVMDGIPVSITIDWRQNVEEKTSHILYDGRDVCIHHSGQRIEDGQQVLEFGTGNRLEQHYCRLFQDLTDKDTDLHKLYDVLFQIGDRL